LVLSLVIPGSALAACPPGATLTAYDDEAALLAGGGGIYVQSSQWPAQSFTVPDSGGLNSVSLFLRNEAPTGDTVTAEIRSDAGGNPGALLGQAAASTTNTTTWEWLGFDLSALGLQLAGGTPYWIVATNPITMNTQGYSWQETLSAAAYPAGISRISPDQGTSWGSPVNADFGFRVIGCGATPASATPPSNAFSFGGVKRNKRNGTALLTVNAGPGTFSLAGKGVRTEQAAEARAIKTAAGSVTLLVKPKGKTRRRLNVTGKVSVIVNVTYTPTGGSSATQSDRVRLVKTLP
jgi:hypothetical protein